MNARPLALVALLATLASCDPNRFAALRRRNPVVAIEAPLNTTFHGFGTQLTATRDPVTGQQWLVVAGDPSDARSPIASLVLTDDVNDYNAMYQYQDVHFLCTAEDPCGLNGGGGGLSLAPMESWSTTMSVDAGTAPDGACAAFSPTGCALTGSLGRDPLVVGRCFSRTGCETTFRLQPPAGAMVQGFGTTVATVPINWRDRTSRASADLAFVSSIDGSGRVWSSLPGRILDLTPPALPSNASFGHSLSVALERSPAVLLAVGAPGLREVFLFRGDGAAMTLVACALRGDVPGFGTRVAVGDFDGDGLLDVASTGDASQGNAAVVVLPGAGMPSSAACTDQPWAGALRYECSDASDARTQCTNARFGASLLAADFDGDGTSELAVGAPGATVDGVAGAGAVWVLRASRGDAGAPALQRAGLYRHGEALAGEGLGTALATWGSSAGRTELLAGAPGAMNVGRVYLMYCSGVSGDRPNESGLDERCQPMR